MARSGPANLGRMGTGLRARVSRVKQSRAAMPQASPARASARVGKIPNGGGAGSARATTSMASVTGQKKINGDKTSRGSVNLHPRADGASRI